MKLTKCYIEKFGKLSKKTFEFSNLNTIYQENSYGKSTLATFLISVIYGLNKQKGNINRNISINENELEKFFPWNANNNEFGGYIEFEKDNNDKIQLQRWFDKEKPSKDKIKIINLKTKKEIHLDLKKEKNIGEKLFSINKMTFERCIYFSQININQFKKDKEEKIKNWLEERCISLITNQTDENIKNAIKNLENQKNSFFAKNTIRSEKITQTEIKINEQKKELEEIKNCEMKKNELIYEKEKLKKEEKDFDKIYKNKSENNIRIKILNEELEKVNNFFNNLKINTDELNNIKNNLITIEECKKNIVENNAEIERINNEIVNIKSKWNNDESIINKYQIWNNNLEEINKKINKLNEKKYLNIICIIFFWLIFPLLIYIKNKINIKKINKQINTLKKTLENYNYKLSFDKNKQYFIDKKIIDEIENYQQKHKKIKNYKNEIILKNQQIDLLKQNINFWENLIHKFNWNNEENYNIQEKITIIKNKINEKKEKEKEIYYAKSQINVLEKNVEQKIKETKNKIEKINIQMEQLNEKIDFKNIIKNEIKKLEQQNLIEKKEIKLIEKTIALLIKTKEEMVDQYLPNLENLFNNYVKEFNIQDEINNYHIDEDFKISAELDGKSKSAEYFSKGYQDLFDICLKFSLIDTLFTKEKPFIIFDDPFTNLDDKKLEKAKELVKTFSKKFQIIYLTCHKSRIIKT